jgi:hypothetical protein
MGYSVRGCRRRGLSMQDALSNQQRRDLESNLRELAGSMGDSGTLFPLGIGYIAAIRAYHALTDERIPRVLGTARKASGLLPEGDSA